MGGSSHDENSESFANYKRSADEYGVKRKSHADRTKQPSNHAIHHFLRAIWYRWSQRSTNRHHFMLLQLKHDSVAYQPAQKKMNVKMAKKEIWQLLIKQSSFIRIINSGIIELSGSRIVEVVFFENPLKSIPKLCHLNIRISHIDIRGFSMQSYTCQSIA